MRTLAIGDIHGCSSMLDDLLAAVQPTRDDLLVFLGDYVDRGPDSKGVLDRLIKLRWSHRVVFLRGNHELMMLRSRKDVNELRMWCGVGGMQCLGSYGSAPGRMGNLTDVPNEHWQFLEEHCVNSFETETHIFAHAGVDPELPLNEQEELYLFWEFLKAPIRHASGKTVIVGHTSQKSGEILDYETTICIDTNAYNGGWLTCLDVGSRRYWQTNIIGRTRSGIVGHAREEASSAGGDSRK
jgi:serine/threonine protein phosphatase 1